MKSTSSSQHPNRVKFHRKISQSEFYMKTNILSQLIKRREWLFILEPAFFWER